MKSRALLTFGPLLLLFAAITAVYANHFHNSFHFDDSHTIIDNPYIREIGNIPRFFRDRTTSSSMPSHQGYRPLVTATLAFDYWVGGGLETFAYHVSNFLWFLVIVLCVFALMSDLLQKSHPHKSNRVFAFSAAAFFGFHTANAETVNYVISRSDILSALAHMLTLVLYVSSTTARRRLLYLVPAAVGMFAKESSTMIVPVFIAYIYLFEEEGSLPRMFTYSGMRSAVRAVMRGLPLLVTCGALAYMTIAVFGSFEPGGSSVKRYALTQPYVIMLYVRAFFLPIHLSADTDEALVSGPTDPRALAGFAFLAVLIGVAFFTSRRKELRPICFGISWFLITLIPTSVVPLAEVMNDHRLFLPLVGLTFALFSCLSEIFLRNENFFRAPARRAAAVGALVLVLCGHAYGTVLRNRVWHTEESLWKDVTKKSPRNGRGWMNYGLTQLNTGRYAAAEQAFREALKYVPNYATLHINLGVLEAATGRKGEAEKDFRLAMLLTPREIEPYFFFARFLNGEGRYGEAAVLLERALKLFPGHLECRHLLLDVYQANGQGSDAKRVAEETIALFPNDEAAHYVLEHPEEHVSLSATAQDLVNESLAFYSVGEWEKCLATAKRALELDPKFAEAHNNICSALIQLGRPKDAIPECEAALALKPNLQIAKNNLTWARKLLDPEPGQ